MTAKYGDRFKTGPATPQRDVLDLGELDGPPRRREADDDEIDLGPPRATPWYASPAARATVAVALVVGVGAGGFGWERWQTYEAGVAARSAVEVVASTSVLAFPAQDTVTLAVRYRNEGEHEIIIRDVRVDSERVSMVDEPRELTVAPGSSETHTFAMQAECPESELGGSDVAVPPSGEEVEEPPALLAEVETVDGAVSQEEFASSLSSDMLAWLGYACESMTYHPVFAEAWPEVIGAIQVEDGAAVEATILLSSGEDLVVSIDSVEPGSSGFSVEVTQETDNDSFKVIYRIAECIVAVQATENDMSLRVSGSFEGSAPGELVVAPSAALAVEVVRLAERTCTS